MIGKGKAVYVLHRYSVLSLVSLVSNRFVLFCFLTYRDDIPHYVLSRPAEPFTNSEPPKPIVNQLYVGKTNNSGSKVVKHSVGRISRINILCQEKRQQSSSLRIGRRRKMHSMVKLRTRGPTESLAKEVHQKYLLPKCVLKYMLSLFLFTSVLPTTRLNFRSVFFLTVPCLAYFCYICSLKIWSGKHLQFEKREAV